MGGDKQTMSTEKPKHMGTKFLALFFGIVLSVMYAIATFFGFAPLLTSSTLMNIAMVTAFFVLFWPWIIMLGEIFWRFVHKYSEKFPVE